MEIQQAFFVFFWWVYKNIVFLPPLELTKEAWCFIYKYRGVEQLVARRAHNPKVAGSSPASATKLESR